MIFITDNIKNGNRIEFHVFDSLTDLSQYVEWQDILDPASTILDEEGNIYVWDNSKTEELGSVYNYSFKTFGTNLDLAAICMSQFVQLGRPDSFEIELPH